MIPAGNDPPKVEPASRTELPAPGGARTGARTAAVCLALFFGTLLLFSRSFQYAFLDLDDPDYFTRNPHVQAGLTLANVRWAFTTDAAGNWHPLTWLSLMLDREWFGDDPRGPHTVNVLWHALNAVLAFLALRRLTGNFWTSAASAALFAWHPLRVESVAWIAERKDVLSVCFALLSLWAYAAYAAKRRDRIKAGSLYALSLVAFAFGLLCKSMLVTLPFLFLLLDGWPLRRFMIYDLRSTISESRAVVIRLLLEKIPFLLLSAAVCLLTLLAQKKAGAIVGTLTFDDRLRNAVMSVAGYLGKFFWPFDLAIGYPRPARWPGLAVAGAACLLLAITVLAVRQRRRNPCFIVGWLWFLGLLVPVIGLVPVGLQAMADRYTYLPILGLQLALLWTVCSADCRSAPASAGPAASRQGATMEGAPQIGNLRYGRLAVCATVTAVLLAACAARTWNQLAHWRNSHALYDHALAVTKGNYLAHSYLGSTLFNEKRFEDARQEFQRAIELRPGYTVARLRLGLTLEKLGRDDDALEAFQATLKSRPDDAEAQFHCANVLARLDRDEEAVAHYARAVELQPDFEPAQCNYADSLRALRRLDEACARYRQALALRPDDAGAHYGLGSALEDSSHPDEALACYRKAIECKPGFAEAQQNAGALLLNRNQAADAIPFFQAAIASRTNFAAAYAGLGFAEDELQRREEAVRDLEKARQLDPNFPGVTEALKRLRESPAGNGGDNR